MTKTRGIAVVVGASSGIGFEIARQLIVDGWVVGAAARRMQNLRALKEAAPARVLIERIDVTDGGADAALSRLIDSLGGMGLYVHVAGIGNKNHTLESSIESDTVATNAAGFCRLVGCAYRYMAENGGGQIAAVTSIAGTKGLGAAPSYSATKAFQSTYLQALAQLSRMRHLHIAVTDIRPGFVDTALIAGSHYPMTMQPSKVARSAVRAIYRRKRICIIDRRWRLLTALWRLVPDCLWRRMAID